MSTVQMPTPPEGHYWRIKSSALSGHRRLYLMRRRRWWFDVDTNWTTIDMSSDENKNARNTVRLANYLLEVWRENHAGFNGLTGYVDHKGVTR